MENHTKEIIGYTGGTLLHLTFIPQIYRTYKTTPTDDISLIFMISQVVTCIFCVVYAFLLNENPLIISNVILLCELLMLLTGKILYSYIIKTSKKNMLIKQDQLMINENKKNDILDIKISAI